MYCDRQTTKQPHGRPRLRLIPGCDMTSWLLLLMAAVSTVHSTDQPTARLSFKKYSDSPLTKGGNLTIVCTLVTTKSQAINQESTDVGKTTPDLTSQAGQPQRSASEGKNENYRNTVHDASRMASSARSSDSIKVFMLTLLKYQVTADNIVRQVPVAEYLVNLVSPSLALQRVPPVELEGHDTESKSPVTNYVLTAHFVAVDCPDEGEYQCQASIVYNGVCTQLVHRAESVTLSTKCPRLCVPFEFSCYILLQGPLNWYAARTRCQALKGDLAIVTSEKESQFLGRLVGPNVEAFIGISDAQRKDYFVWANGALSNFRNWHQSSPTPKPGRNCGVIVPDSGQWKDVDCSESRPFVCEVSHARDPSEGNNTVAKGCPGPWFELKHACYEVFFDDKNFTEAVKACVNWGSQLAEFHIYNEFLPIQEWFSAYNQTAFIGLRRKLPEFRDVSNIFHEYRWPDDSTSDTQFWGSQAKSYQEFKDCVELKGNSGELSVGFNDVECQKVQPYICQKILP